MQLGPYNLLTLLGEAADGAAYHAQHQGDFSPAEVRTLAGAQADPARWGPLSKRLRLAAMLGHPAAVRVRDLGLEHQPPFVALEWVERDGPAVVPRAPLPAAQALARAHDLAAAVAAAHRLGLVHGRLGPGAVRATPEGALKIDFTGVEAPGDAGALDASCPAPEHLGGEAVDSAVDVYSLGGLIGWLFTGRSVPAPTGDDLGHLDPVREALPAEVRGPVGRLLGEMLHPDPDERPSAHVVELRLAEMLRPAADRTPAWPWPGAATAVAEDELLGGCLGRFRLVAKLGEGGMGVVYRAEDVADGAVVAVKVVRPELAGDPVNLRRLLREARLLKQVNNPYVANLLEVNEDRGVRYLALEFVAGRSLRDVLRERGRLLEPAALAIAADAARALRPAHEQGIVHRDVKPGNLILLPEGAEGGGPARPRVKLLDFGLARPALGAESQQLTQAGQGVGTPLYMAPEQHFDREVGPTADVYALGVTLFELLAGRPPFLGEDVVSTLLMHRNDPVPPLTRFNPSASEGVRGVVERALAKAPAERYPDAGAMLQDLERLLRGEATHLHAHPALPPCDPRRVFARDWVWELAASPAQLWPYVSDTDRLNRAVGLPAVTFTARAEPGRGVRRFGRFRKVGMTVEWEEHPFEWVEGRRFGVLREYSRGPFRWLMSVVELEPRADGGTRLTHRVRLEPAGLLGRLVAAVEVGVKGRKAVEQVYRRIDAVVAAGAGDAFEPPAPPSRGRRRRLGRRLDRLLHLGVAPVVVERLGDFLAYAPAQEVARLRPLALAQKLGLDPEEVLAACLHAAREGLLVLLWAILCPACRVPSQIQDTLRHLREHGHCEACNLNFELDFANSVEMVFRAHPEVRAADVGVYCIGGPVHSPHVVCQVRVAPGERVELRLALEEGEYRFRGPQLPFAIDFRVHPLARATRWDLALPHDPGPELPRTLKAGAQTLAVANGHDHELVVRVERAAPRADALTAARASASALFRRLFPGEVLAPGQLVGVAGVTLLVTRLDQGESSGSLYEELGEARAFGLIHEHFWRLEERLRHEGGAVVKTVGEGLVAAFHDTAAAVRVALGLQGLLLRAEATRRLRLCVGVHRGPAFAATLNDRLDYFGTTAALAARLAEQAGGGEVVVTPAVIAAPHVEALLRARGLRAEPLRVSQPGRPGYLAYRLATPGAAAAPAAGAKEVSQEPDPGSAGRWRSGFQRACLALRQFADRLIQDPRFDRPELRPLREELLRPTVEFYREVAQRRGAGADEEAERGQACLRLASMAGRIGLHEEAVAYSQRAVEVFGRLARAHPEDLHHLTALAEGATLLGNELLAADHPGPAVVPFRKAVAAMERLTGARPADWEFAVGLGVSCYNMGRAHKHLGDVPAALDWYGRAVQALAVVPRQESAYRKARPLTHKAHKRRARAFERQGDYAAAAREWEGALGCAKVGDEVPLRFARAAALARAGASAAAVAEAEALAEGPSPEAEDLYKAARVLTLAAPHARGEALAQEYLGRAVAYLARAQAVGYFKVRANREALANDPDLDAVRQHPEFARLFQTPQEARQPQGPPPEARPPEGTAGPPGGDPTAA